MDFEYLIFLEYDTYTTKTIAELYERYRGLDAAFVNYREAEPSWYYYDYPTGARRSVLNWLTKRRMRRALYACLFGGTMLSKKALEVLADQRLPYGFCEMRLPTVLTGLGLKCGRLDFPMVRYRPLITMEEVSRHCDRGIFHPVKAE